MNPSKRRRKLPTRGVRPVLQHAIQPLQLHHVGALHACYEEHVWPRIRDSVLMPTCEQLGTRVQHEVELGAVISSTPVAKLSAGQLPVPTPSPSSLLSGDNPWRNDLRHLVHAGQEGISWYPHFLPFELPVRQPHCGTRSTLLEQTHPAAVGVPVLVHAHHLEALYAVLVAPAGVRSVWLFLNDYH